MALLASQIRYPYCLVDEKYILIYLYFMPCFTLNLESHGRQTTPELVYGWDYWALMWGYTSTTQDIGTTRTIVGKYMKKMVNNL